MNSRRLVIRAKTLIFSAFALAVSVGVHAESVVCSYELRTYYGETTSQAPVCQGAVTVSTPSDLAAAVKVLQQQLTQQKADFDALTNKLDAVLKELQNVKAEREREKQQASAAK